MIWKTYKLPKAVLEVGTIEREDGKEVAAELRVKPVIPLNELVGLWQEAVKVIEREYPEPPSA